MMDPVSPRLGSTNDAELLRLPRSRTPTQSHCAQA
jgi:hypothetical protein